MSASMVPHLSACSELRRRTRRLPLNSPRRMRRAQIHIYRVRHLFIVNLHLPSLRQFYHLAENNYRCKS